MSDDHSQDVGLEDSLLGDLDAAREQFFELLRKAKQAGVEDSLIDQGHRAAFGGALSRDEFLKMADILVRSQLTLVDALMGQLVNDPQETITKIKMILDQGRQASVVFRDIRIRSATEKTQFADRLSEALETLVRNNGSD